MRFITFIIFSGLFFTTFSQKTIHTFVALCDNQNQGIVPVPAKIGNGQDPKNNLYWGCGYGVKSFFKLKTTDWKFIATLPSPDTIILERVIFKHADKNVYMLADAYDGKYIKKCIEDYMLTLNGQTQERIFINQDTIHFGGNDELVAYTGHDGLMEFSIEIDYRPQPNNNRDAIILACYSKSFFENEVRKSGANPILWTTHLMAPEAYTLKAAIDGWLNHESGIQIEERAAQTYNQYQKCGLKGARNLFTTGF